MKRVLFTAVLTMSFSASSGIAADDCAELCDAEYYVSATADSVQKLLDSGVDVNARDEVGKSAMHWTGAAKPEVISVLLAAGADVNAKDQWDRTPLHFVAATGSVENIRLLLDAGAEVNAKTANDWTPIHGAAKFGRPENVVVLLGAGADAAARTEMGESAFDFGLTNDNFADTDALKLLKEGQ